MFDMEESKKASCIYCGGVGFKTNGKAEIICAFEANQIYGPNEGRSENSIGLTSEDLY